MLTEKIEIAEALIVSFALRANTSRAI